MGVPTAGEVGRECVLALRSQWWKKAMKNKVVGALGGAEPSHPIERIGLVSGLIFSKLKKSDEKLAL